MATVANAARFRLRATSAGATLRVDRESGHGVIRGLAILSPGPAKGHGFDVDTTTAQQVVAMGDGMKGRWTHPNLCADGLGHYLGRWRNLRLSPAGVAVGDFHFGRAAHDFRPQGLGVSAAEYLMRRAEEVAAGEEPADVLGVSIVADMELTERMDADPLGRVVALEAADFVDTPAANEGLFGDGPSQFAARGTDHLNYLASELGEARVAAFLRSWLSGRGLAAAEGSVEEDKSKDEGDMEEAEGEGPSAEDMAARVKALEEIVAARDGQIAAYEAEKKARAEADLAAKRAKQAEYVRSLQDQSAKLQSPIPTEKLSLVEKAFERGDDESARALGEAFLAAADAKARLAGATGAAPTSAQPLGTTEDADKQWAAAMVARLQKNGVNAVLTEDGRNYEIKPRSAARSN